MYKAIIYYYISSYYIICFISGVGVLKNIFVIVNVFTNTIDEIDV